MLKMLSVTGACSFVQCFSGSSCPEGEALQLPDGGPVKRRLAELVWWRFTTSGGLSPA
jgi:hypothetical protein